MGKYTDLARKAHNRPQGEDEVLYNNSVNIYNIYSGIDTSIDKPTSDRPEDTLKGSPPVETRQDVASGHKDGAENRGEGVTNVRSTNLTKLNEGEEVWIATTPDPHRYTKLARGGAAVAEGASVVRCIHDTTRDACGVCSGYARWLAADGERLRRAQADPEAVRREFWREVSG